MKQFLQTAGTAMTFTERPCPKRSAPVILPIILLLLFLLCACHGDASQMKSGFYSAEAAGFDDYGWKEYITLYVSNNTIVTVDYNAKNASGFIKSWDMDYMGLMNSADGTYPNKYTREYGEALLRLQDPSQVDAITGATHSYDSFQRLAAAAIAQARAGNGDVAYVDLTEAAG